MSGSRLPGQGRPGPPWKPEVGGAFPGCGVCGDCLRGALGRRGRARRLGHYRGLAQFTLLPSALGAPTETLPLADLPSIPGGTCSLCVRSRF